MEICQNLDVLKVLYFFFTLIDIVKIIIPIGLIVLGIIDFSKAVVVSDEKVQKNTVNLFVKRIVYAILVFAVPWIVKVLMVTLGDALGKEGTLNFTDCIQNANEDYIKQLEEAQKNFGNNEYTIRYDFQNGDPSNINLSEFNVVNKKIPFTIPDTIPTKAGWDFKGWKLDNSYNGKKVFKPGESFVVNESIKPMQIYVIGNAKGTIRFLALWGNFVEVEFNGGSGRYYGLDALEGTKYDLTFEFQDPEREGYTFKGWSKDNKNIIKDPKNCEFYANEKQLYAMWEPKS